MVILELDGRTPSLDSLSKSVSQKKRDTAAQRQMERVTSIKNMFSELRLRAGRRKDECVSAFLKYVTLFEEWLLKILYRLKSGELLTTDILVFEENLTVSLFFSFFFLGGVYPNREKSIHHSV